MACTRPECGHKESQVPSVWPRKRQWASVGPPGLASLPHRLGRSLAGEVVPEALMCYRDDLGLSQYIQTPAVYICEGVALARTI